MVKIDLSLIDQDWSPNFHRIFVWLIHRFWYINLPDVTASYEMPLDSNAFLDYFHTYLTTIHVWSIVSSSNFNRLCIWLIYTFCYVNIPNAIADYGIFSDLIAFFLIFIHYYMFEALQLKEKQHRLKISAYITFQNQI